MADWIFQSAQRVASTHVRLEFVSATTPPTALSLHVAIENAKKLVDELAKATDAAKP